MPSHSELLCDAEHQSKEHAPEVLYDEVRQRYPNVSIR